MWEVGALTEENDFPNSETITERMLQVESTRDPGGKKLFVEPMVSAATEVLEATTFFQAPTIESATT